MEIKLESKKIKNKVLYSNKFLKELRTIHENIHSMSCPNCSGWVDAPNELSKRGITIIKEKAKEFKSCTGVLILADEEEYLTLNAILNAMQDSIKKEVVLISALFSVKEIETELKKLENKNFQFFIVSKEMDKENMLEAFRILETFVVKKYKKGEEFRKKITAITDYEKGKLNTIANEEKYDIVVYPRVVNSMYCAFSVATLLPLVVAGVDIESFIFGAKEGYTKCFNFDLETNYAYRLAIICKLLNLKKYKTKEYIVATNENFLTSLLMVVKNMLFKRDKNGTKILLLNTNKDRLTTDEYIIKKKNREGLLFVLEKETQINNLEKLDQINIENASTLFNEFKNTFSEKVFYKFSENIEQDLGELFYMLYMLGVVI